MTPLPDADPPPAGSRVRLRPAADWSPDAPPDRPLACPYADPAGVPRTVYWSATLDAAARAGDEYDVTGPGVAGLVRVAPAGVDANGGSWDLHPCWLAWDRPDPAGPPCVCPTHELLVRGCRCGRIQRERAAR